MNKNNFLNMSSMEEGLEVGSVKEGIRKGKREPLYTVDVARGRY